MSVVLDPTRDRIQSASNSPTERHEALDAAYDALLALWQEARLDRALPRALRTRVCQGMHRCLWTLVDLTVTPSANHLDHARVAITETEAMLHEVGRAAILADRRWQAVLAAVR